jgi:hypothetical protein
MFAFTNFKLPKRVSESIGSYARSKKQRGLLEDFSLTDSKGDERDDYERDDYERDDYERDDDGHGEKDFDQTEVDGGDGD